MKIIQQEEFFTLYNSKGMKFEDWLETFEKPNMRDNTKDHFKDSSFIEDITRIQLKELRYKIFILAIVADWCGDCRRNVPILEHISKASEFVELRLLKKEEHLELIMPSNGGEKIPYVMFYSQDGFLISNWIERSYQSYKIISDISKKYNYTKSEEFFKRYRESVDMNKKNIYESTKDEIINSLLKVNAIQGCSSRINKTEA